MDVGASALRWAGVALIAAVLVTGCDELRGSETDREQSTATPASAAPRPTVSARDVPKLPCRTMFVDSPWPGARDNGTVRADAVAARVCTFSSPHGFHAIPVITGGVHELVDVVNGPKSLSEEDCNGAALFFTKVAFFYPDGTTETVQIAGCDNLLVDGETYDNGPDVWATIRGLVEAAGTDLPSDYSLPRARHRAPTSST